MTAGARAFDRSIRAKSESLPVQDGKTVNLFVLLPFLGKKMSLSKIQKFALLF